MSCYNCATKLHKLLSKEVGCENCGFSFCSKCCRKQQCPTKSGESNKLTVCNACYKKLTGGETHTASKYSPPLAHRKRMEALKKQSMSVDSGSHFNSEWSNAVDKSLAERLQKLKRDRVKADLPSEDEIKVRLAKLKGIDPAVYTAPPIQVFTPMEKLTSDQQAQKLMQQFTDEVQIESKFPKPEDEIAERLAKLRDQPPPSKVQDFNIDHSLVNQPSEEMKAEDVHTMLEQESKKATQLASEELKILNTDESFKKLQITSQSQRVKSESEDDDEEAEKIVKKFLETGFSDEVDELEDFSDINSEKINEEEEEELPWCVICNEDARIKCFGCEGDLYCNSCFKECHDSLDIKDHKTRPFHPPKVPA